MKLNKQKKQWQICFIHSIANSLSVLCTKNYQSYSRLKSGAFFMKLQNASNLNISVSPVSVATYFMNVIMVCWKNFEKWLISEEIIVTREWHIFLRHSVDLETLCKDLAVGS